MNLLKTTWRRALAMTGLFLFGAGAIAGEPPKKGNLLDTVKPKVADFKATMFAEPPDVSYPACLCAAPTGEVYVGVDQNGSLDAKPDRGWVVRCIDTDGDGKADKFNKFVEKVDSPRGLFFDDNTLYVLHPPDLTAYTDTNGDGVADKVEELAKGIGFDLKFRGADHTTNGMMMGIDGWLYIAVGDYGFIKGVDKSGKEMNYLGGGIIRIRPDGNEMEVVSRGQRNIYDVAIDPLMNLYTRDNTNDGGGWDVRLSHVPQTAHMGYPMLFKNFNEETVQPLFIYGGGSPCGSIYIDEPVLPAPWNRMLYTVEWGQQTIMAHTLTPKGATFTPTQERLVDLPRPTDMDIDGSGRIYIASWINGQFKFEPTKQVGYVTRITPKDFKAAPFPDLKKASEADLVKAVASKSHILRLYAQREILRRGAKPEIRTGLEAIVTGGGAIESKVAAIFTLKQLLGKDANAFLATAAETPALTEFALKALADRIPQNDSVPAQPFLTALKSADPRVRVQAAVGLGRLGKVEHAAALLPLSVDTDPVVAHVAINALITLKASDAAFEALDKEVSRYGTGALRVLQGLHDPKVVAGMIERFEKTKDPATRRLAFKGLARLHFKEAPYAGKWWTTRPDTRGPYYNPQPWDESPKIFEVLKAAITKEKEPDLLRYMIVEHYKHRLDIPEVFPMMLKLANEDAEFRSKAVELVLNRPSVPPEAIGFLETAGRDKNVPVAVRVQALQGLTKANNPQSLDAAVGIVAEFNATEKLAGDLAKARKQFFGEGALSKQIPHFVKISQGADAAKREVAFAVLATLGDQKLTSKEGKEACVKAIDAGLGGPNADSAKKGIALSEVKAYDTKIASAGVKTTKPAPTAAKGPLIDSLKPEDVKTAAIKGKGDAAHGKELFTKLSCVNCHTVSKNEPPKGPFLGDIAGRYSRADLAESILEPNAKVAQGFESVMIKLKEGGAPETGFITKESGDEIEIRGATGEPKVIKTANIALRKKLETSIMPEGLLDQVTVDDFAALLTYLGTLTGHEGEEK